MERPGNDSALVAVASWLRPSPAALGITRASTVLLSLARAVSGTDTEGVARTVEMRMGPEAVLYVLAPDTVLTPEL